MDRVFIVAVPEEVGHVTEILGSPVIFSGVGKVNAAMAATRACERGYTRIINLGSCGSVKRKAGEFFKIGTVFQDIDSSPIAEYGLTPFESGDKHLTLDHASDISLFTTDYFYDSDQEHKYSNHYLRMVNECDIMDMECYALAKVCAAYKVEFHAYKWVSDDGDAASWQANCKIGFEHVLKLID